MPLKVGSPLGIYEVLALEGAGGMGEVYRARDTRLHRDVALKVLPEHLDCNPEALARLEREAHLLAALNHPNIASIYGFEDCDGIRALVLELVEGPTLADRLARGSIPLHDAIAIARQIASALDAAHEQGIIHRDLKPSNIKLRPDGTVKVLDFGLAKALDSAGAGSDVHASTITGAPFSMILGTAAYMSPEQARGHPVDRRTDVWAFGCVLFEMLTGRRAFAGSDIAQIMAAVLTSEPDWRALPPHVPPMLLLFLRRCLRKELTDRVRDIGDVRLALDGAFDPEPAAATRPALGRRALLWVALAAGLASVGAAGYFARALAPAPRMTLSQFTFREGKIGKARFAPDGQVVLYAASWDDEPYRLYSTRVGSFQSRVLDLPPADLLAVSKGGDLAISVARPAIDGFEPDGVMAVASLAGGAARELYDDVVGVDWAPDGQTMALARRVATGAQLEFPIGRVVHEANLILPPRISPDGSRVCFFAGPAYGNLMVADRGGPARLLAERLGRGGHCAWSPDGREVWVESSPAGEMHMTLEAIDLSGARRVVATFPGVAYIQDISSDGRILIAAGTNRYSVHGSPAPGRPERDLTAFDASRLMHLAANGRKLLLWDNSQGAMPQPLFLRLMDGTAPVQLGPGGPVALTPDEQWAVVIGDGVSNQRIRNKLTFVPTGVGQRRTTELPIQIEPPGATALGRTDWARRSYDFSADGNRLLMPFGRAPDRPPRVYVHDLRNGWTRPITPEGVTGPAVLSPDGRVVVVNQNTRLVAYSVDTGESHDLAGPGESGLPARWSADGQSVFLFEPLGYGARLVRRAVETGERVVLREIRIAHPAGVTMFDPWISADGQAYAYTTSRQTTNLFLVQGLK